MKKLNEFWDFMDGKKTAFGMYLVIAGHAMEMIPATAPAAKVVVYVGEALGGLGLFHKAVK